MHVNIITRVIKVVKLISIYINCIHIYKTAYYNTCMYRYNITMDLKKNRF